MTQDVKIGSILVREDTVFPPSVSVETDAFFAGWKFVRNLDGYGLARMFAKANWNFFYLAAEIRAIAFGHGAPAACRALKRILAKREGQNYNSLEITEVTAKRFLGIPLISVKANSRHIQEGIGLIPTKDFVLRNPAWAPGERAVTRRYTMMVSRS
jgi:hypothetical protein